LSFRARLLLVFGYLLAAVTLALEVPLALNVQTRAESEFRSQVLGNAAVLAARISEPVAAQPADAAARDRINAIVAETARTSDVRILVTDRTGAVVTDSEGRAAVGTPYASAERPEFGEALFKGQIDFRRRFSDTLGEELLLVTVPVVDAGRVVGAARLSADTGGVQSSVQQSWLRLALIGLAVVAGAMVLALVLATSLARPVRDLAAAAQRLGDGDLKARAPVRGPAEISGLARAFNSMADALGANLRAQRDFVANASHQLRTPLTGLRLRVEGIKAEGGAAAEEATKAEAEIDRLSRVVDDLLTLARASSVDATAVRVGLDALAREAVERWRGPFAAEGKVIREGSIAAAHVWASPRDLANILDNLIENALRYGPPGTEATVDVGARDGRSALVVSDTGPGIRAEDRARVFERFYRGSNGREAGVGTGLGLAIVAELAGRWDGQVRLLDGPGTRIEATFPAHREILNRSLTDSLPVR
jgi:signal transduction histidine kinase